MSTNGILGIFLILILLTFFSCMIAGDAFINKIAFSSTAMDCDSFADIPTSTQAPAPAPAPTQAPAPSPTQAPAPAPSPTQAPTQQQGSSTMAATIAATITTLPAQSKTIKNGTCINMDSMQLGFVKFRIAMYWITFIILSGLCGYGSIVLINYGWLGIVFLVIGLSLWIFKLVGGIFLSQFAFEATEKTCNSGKAYCYDLNTSKIVFARMVSVFSFIETFIITGLIVYLLYNSV
jgi:hypothetical protein